ncbi:MAG: putative nucleotidyltransferase [Gammaproteobacteria bacterium]|jgi:predicted nucleotidyltransferase
MASLLGDVLFTKTQQRVLGLLYGNPGKTFYLNELVRLAGVGKGSVNRELIRMLNAGLLTKDKVGNQNHFQANKECPIYHELLVLVRKTFGIVDVIKQALLPLEDEIDFAFVYGSIAKGEENAKSDIDLMIVTSSLEYTDVINSLMDVEKSLGRPINPTLYTSKQIKNKLKSKNAFISRVMEQDKLWIKGSQDDIKGIR